MSTTITLPTVELKSVTRALASDWGPTLYTTARRIAAVLAAVYTVWVMAKERWHQLVAWAVEHELQGLARLGLPGGNVKALLTGSAAPDHFAGVNKMVVQRQASALPPARSIGIAPPSIQHLAAEGFSQRVIADKLGITRYQVRKALKA
jgi:hypothetical protein